MLDVFLAVYNNIPNTCKMYLSR